ncbi:type III secretion protein HrpV [Pseudomonas sp. GD03842]|uniref:type III secretion protein HrpV n=1 Tax=unclassified Pseudomonas TaxID=196821 RepID=UPI000D35EA37|nr:MULTISPECIES: type III secretion protein HrpV [unclassified Pseudomonas]MDH0744985.1 type III secretion protein HrpV [Pseudomonas sp. GD03842]RAU41514.1 type III secretion protein HrpV [Pseudomonas sp. RIT 409]RAU53355.1 type III secretion protein HrpV [Pseudomonas sp. RIT 412]
MIRVSEKHAFYSHVAAERAAIWPVASGVAFVSRREHRDWGIALHIEGRALRPDQLRDALERRFAQAEVFDEYFLFLDVQRDFVVWHAVPSLADSTLSLDSIRQHELMLAGLEHLNDGL